jgi:sortase A
MMIRDRVVRTLSAIALIAGLAALLGAGGAVFEGAPTRPVASTSTTTVSPDRAAVVAAHASTHVDEPLPVTHAKPQPARVELPSSVPARLLPAGSTLPVPAPLPANPWARHAVTQLGRIVIPKIHVSQPIFEGVDQAAFANGPGHWPGSALPGQWGNAVFGGHRTTQTHPFLDTDQLRAGDEIDFVMQSGWTYVYRVSRVFVVSDNALWIKNQGPGRNLTLFTCNPKGSATSRLVTTGVLDRIDAAT